MPFVIVVRRTKVAKIRPHRAWSCDVSTRYDFARRKEDFEWPEAYTNVYN